ncbi:hypothetical protein [Sorangium sp. So ce362]|uniref:hypothetical protein n=1 Tax=Sorangium sp. So ce362 TaxID=3133303 RepID=UPI003F636C93
MERQTEDEATFPRVAATVECIVPKRVEELQMFEYSPAWPHGKLRIAFPELFFVIGTNKTQHDGVGIQTSRTMVVVREDGALTLLNTVRLTEEGLRDLEGLGEVRNVVRLGAFHGRDDPFYRDRYGATLWTLPGAAPLDGRGPDRELASGGAFPVRTGEVFVFSSARFPEAAVLLHHEGGILITCDAVQNWTHIDEFFSPRCGELFAEQGLIRAANIPSTWRLACHPSVDDFRRLLALPFRHLISAHGEPLRDEAHALLKARTDEVFSA